MSVGLDCKVVLFYQHHVVVHVVLMAANGLFFQPWQC